MEPVDLAYDEYTEANTSPAKCPIILLHGFFWNKYMFKDLAKDLCKATGRKVFCLDLRNHDESPFREECSTTLMVEDIKKFIQDLQLEKVSFVCHSFSSTIAYLVALDQPEKVEKIVMIDHPPFYVHDALNIESVQSQFAAQQRVLSHIENCVTLSAAKEKILSLCKNAEKSQAPFFEKAAYELIIKNGKFDWKTNHQYLTELFIEGGCFFPKPRGSSNHEILIIRCPDSLRVTDEDFEATLKFHPKARLITFPGTSHLLMLEEQDKFVKAVKNFLA